jgi:uroporphyrin-3 C-methyltransferase
MDQTQTVKVARFNGALWLALLALIVAMALTAAALIYGRNVNFLLKTMNYNNQLLHRQMQQIQGIQITLLDRLNQQAQQFAKQQQLQAGNKNIWILSEVNYLARLANYNLNYTRDIPAAIALLQTADQRVAQLNDPNLNQVRQQLANNITALQAAGKLDTVGILAKLSALQAQIKQLPLISPPKFNVQPKTNNASTAADLSTWRKVLADSMATLKALVIIRHHQQPIEPLLGSEQYMYLQQNLQLQLQQAQWAVLHAQKTIYQNSLQQAINWVQNYYASASPQTTAFIQNIQQLQKIDIQPALPDMTALLNLLSRAIDQPAATKANEEE